MTKQITFSIDPAIFSKFPGYRRAIVVATGVDNKQTSPLADDVARITADVKNGVSLEDPRIVAWRQAFAACGIKTRDFRPRWMRWCDES